MKKLFATFILFIFFINIIGYYVPYYLIRSLIRSEMNKKTEKLRDEVLLEKISFKLSEASNHINWTRQGKEFEFKNEMYDIVKVEIKNNVVTYFCIQDKDEYELNQVLDSLIKNNITNNNKRKFAPVKELSKYNLDKYELLKLNQSFSVQNYFIKDFYISIHRDINLPPPKLI